jgi:hypothetical protein
MVRTTEVLVCNPDEISIYLNQAGNFIFRAQDAASEFPNPPPRVSGSISSARHWCVGLVLLTSDDAAASTCGMST